MRMNDPMPQAIEQSAQNLGNERIIFNQQDQLATQRQGGFFAGHVFICPGGNRGQYHQHRGSLAGLALNRDAATRLLGEAMSHGEAEPAAAAIGAGGDEAPPQPGLERGRDRRAVVVDRDPGGVGARGSRTPPKRRKVGEWTTARGSQTR